MKIVSNPQKLIDLKGFIKSFDFMFCVDVEATCDEIVESETFRSLLVTPDEMETIEIGLVVIDLRSLKILEVFQSYVRPVIHPILTPFCMELTTIKQGDIDRARIFPEVAMEITYLQKKYPNAVWGSWGHYDFDQLQADSIRAGCTPVLSETAYLDVERLYCELFSNTSAALRPAVESLGLSWKGQYHRGVDDAKNLAEMIKSILDISN
ncbi:3'-5' exonuclease [Pseudomonas alliivorans]|nr:3'-5' exonuclease [Pseudomonas alliivorans]MEE4703808.1 3'-5' exonuclease [Pseudomonas alliivorans]MEE4739782.1 3'-5' exonuclease [Pseudomonas alliivorans]